jgi:type II secretory pathway pseudopilin PulG
MQRHTLQSGQTLIETMVAIFVLVMGVSAAVGLAVYSLGAANTIRKQTIALGLAREGIEAVKIMRDTNWLKDSLTADCYNYTTGTTTAQCYKSWLNTPGGYNIQPPGGNQSYYLSFDASTNSFWSLNNSNNRFGLQYDGVASGLGYYYAPNGGVSATSATSQFARKITIETDTTGPFQYNNNLGPRLKVTSQVWWVDKRCPASDDFPGTGKCGLQLQTYLTNWKNY